MQVLHRLLVCALLLGLSAIVADRPIPLNFRDVSSTQKKEIASSQPFRIKQLVRSNSVLRVAFEAVPEVPPNAVVRSFTFSLSTPGRDMPNWLSMVDPYTGSTQFALLFSATGLRQNPNPASLAFQGTVTYTIPKQPESSNSDNKDKGNTANSGSNTNSNSNSEQILTLPQEVLVICEMDIKDEPTPSSSNPSVNQPQPQAMHGWDHHQHHEHQQQQQQQILQQQQQYHQAHAHMDPHGLHAMHNMHGMHLPLDPHFMHQFALRPDFHQHLMDPHAHMAMHGHAAPDYSHQGYYDHPDMHMQPSASQGYHHPADLHAAHAHSHGYDSHARVPVHAAGVGGHGFVGHPHAHMPGNHYPTEYQQGNPSVSPSDPSSSGSGSGSGVWLIISIMLLFTCLLLLHCLVKRSFWRRTVWKLLAAFGSKSPTPPSDLSPRSSSTYKFL